MRSVTSDSSRRWSRLAVMGVLAVGFAGCSPDTSRFNDSNSNPFASRSSAPAEVTGTVQAAPTSQIASQPLAPPPSRDITGSISHWHAPSVAAVPHTAPAAAVAGNVHVVAQGETLMSISRRYHKPLKQIAEANRISLHTHLKIDERIVIPGRMVAAATPTPNPAPRRAVAAPKVPPRGARAPASAPAASKAAEDGPTSVSRADEGGQATGDAGAKSGAPEFRWPLRGRVINGFAKNDGIDLAVPEGTAVHAAEDGVVAYAGSDLKGYGNLILIRHANGYVTAYAHASELMVKRNDTVRRGQVIAKSGQTGSGSSPQLHFEIRKESRPIDPMQFLPAH